MLYPEVFETMFVRVRRVGNPVTEISTAVLIAEEPLHVHPLNCALVSIKFSPSPTDNSKIEPFPLARVTLVKTQQRVCEDSVTVDIVKRLAVRPTERRGEELRRIPLNSTDWSVRDPSVSTTRKEVASEGGDIQVKRILERVVDAWSVVNGAAALFAFFVVCSAPSEVRESPVMVRVLLTTVGLLSGTCVSVSWRDT